MPTRPLASSLAIALALGVAGCSAWDAVSQSAVGKGGGVQAVLAPNDRSSGRADVRFVDRGDGVFMTVFVTNLRQGAYRVVIHAVGNCSSPNFFSAGPAWAPPGSARAAKDLTPVFHVSSDGDGTWTVQIPGVHTSGPDSLEGRSVVLHSGSNIDDFVPGVPNNGYMCGVVGPLRSFAL